MTDTKTYWVAPDAYDDIALWSGTGPDDPHCDCVVYKRSLDGMDPILWPTLVAALVPPDVETAELLADIRAIYADTKDECRFPHAVRHYWSAMWAAGHKIGLREAKEAVERICAVATTGSDAR